MEVDTRKTVLVTGASGFVGNNLVRLLLQRGRKVRALVREPNPKSLVGLKVEQFVGDVLDPASLRGATADVSSVFHLVGAIAIDGQENSRMRQINVEGTANVVKACLDFHVGRMIHFSSIHALSYLPKDQPINEARELSLDPEKHLAYDQSKAVGEQAVLAGIQLGLNAVILNPVGILGPKDFDPSPAGEFIRQLCRRQLPGLVRAGYYWVDVRDVAQAAAAAEATGRIGARYILSGEYATFKTIAGWVQETTGVRPPMFNLPMWTAKIIAPIVVWYSRMLRVRPLVTRETLQIVECHQNISTSKAANELGFHSRPLRETIFDTVNWLQEH